MKFDTFGFILGMFMCIAGQFAVALAIFYIAYITEDQD